MYYEFIPTTTSLSVSFCSILFILSISAFCSWLLLFLIIPVLNRSFLDHPNARTSHHVPTPRGGGIVFVFLALLSSFIDLFLGASNAFSYLPLTAVPLAVIGLIDDRFSLPVSLRFVAQIFTAILVILISPLFKGYLYSLAGFLFPALLLIFLIIVVSAIINFTNFMDGLDGLVCGCMTLSIASLSLSLDASWSVWVLVGALIGFLFWNWSPAKVFMGDVGSTFIGALFAGLVLQAPSCVVAFSYVLVATPLFGDAFVCVLRRLFAGQPVFQAHRLHLFQRLNQAGLPHARVSLLYVSATAVLAVALLTGNISLLFFLSFSEVLFGVWLDQRIAVPFALASNNS